MAEINLRQEELRDRATAVVERAGNPTQPFGAYLFEPTAPESELARHVERVVFDRWFGNSRETLEVEYGPHEEQVFFLCVIDHRRRLPAGMARFGAPSSRRRKSFDDIEAMWGVEVANLELAATKSWSVDDTWDSLTIGVLDEYRGKATDGLISLALLQTAVRLMRRCAASTAVTIVDLRVLELFQTMLREPYQVFIGLEPRQYLDSPLSVPAMLDLDDWEPRLAAADPGLHAIMFRGVGIETVVRPAEWPAFVASSVTQRH